jgi:hypothetical protein
MIVPSAEIRALGRLGDTRPWNVSVHNVTRGSRQSLGASGACGNVGTEGRLAASARSG